MSSIFARFAVERGKITKPTNQALRVHRKLFEPNDERNVSISKIDDLLCDEVKREGVRVARERDKQYLYGWAIITRGVLQLVGFEPAPDPPPPSHFLLEEWPPEREDQLMLQRKLAQESTAVLLKEKIVV